MKSTIRVVVSSITGLATYYFVFWVPFSLILQGRASEWATVRFFGSLLCAVVATRYVWRHSSPWSLGLVGSVVVGALVTGGIGFIAGFFGPIIFAPGANQGPMLGIFITGPLGVLAGAIGGGILWFARGKGATTDSANQGG